MQFRFTKAASTGTNIPSHPSTPHGLQANAQRQRNIILMEKTIGILTQTCPPNAPSMETPCNSDSPKLPQMPEPWKHHGNLTPSCRPVTNAGQVENTMEIWLQALHQSCHKCCTSWKYHVILTTNGETHCNSLNPINPRTLSPKFATNQKIPTPNPKPYTLKTPNPTNTTQQCKN